MKRLDDWLTWLQYDWHERRRPTCILLGWLMFVAVLGLAGGGS